MRRGGGQRGGRGAGGALQDGHDDLLSPNLGRSFHHLYWVLFVGCKPLLGGVNTAAFKMDNQQGPTVEHTELRSCDGIWMGAAFRAECIHVCVRLSPFIVHLRPSPCC